MNDIDSIRIVNAIKRLSYRNQPNNMIFGKVVSVSPLKIDIGNNVVLTKRFLYLGQMCRPFKVTIPHTHKYNGETEKATATGGGTYTSPPIPPTHVPNPNPTETTGDLLITSASTSGVTTVTEFAGHSHKIENQVTENVHENGGDYDKSVTIEIYPKLNEGDIVLMFAMNGNQMYYVAERVEKES